MSEANVSKGCWDEKWCFVRLFVEVIKRHSRGWYHTTVLFYLACYGDGQLFFRCNSNRMKYFGRRFSCVSAYCCITYVDTRPRCVRCGLLLIVFFALLLNGLLFWIAYCRLDGKSKSMYQLTAKKSKSKQACRNMVFGWDSEWSQQSCGGEGGGTGGRDLLFSSSSCAFFQPWPASLIFCCGIRTAES